MPILSISPLTTDLLPTALALDQKSLGGLWSADAYQREIESPNSDLLVLSDGSHPSSLKALGCSWAILEEAHITLLAVHPAHCRQGLGQAMLYALLEAAYIRQLERATLEVRVSNGAAIALYKKFGFREAGKRKRYYQDTGEDALILWRSGLHHPDFSEQLQQWQQEVRDRLLQHNWQINFERADGH